MTYDYEPDYEPDPMEGYEPDPTDHPEFQRYERERYLRTLSPVGRVRYRVSSLIWRYTWRWRIKPSTPGGDEPPF
jgi:hypothetical protein